MPTKRMFDLGVVLFLGMTAAMKLPKLWAARHAREGSGVTKTIADAIRTAE